MNCQNISKTVRGLFSALLFSGLVVSAQAGPTVHYNYVPVKTMKQAEVIKPGTHLAVTCGKCGGMTLFTAGNDHSYLHGYMCPTCKAKFVIRPVGGRGMMVGLFVYDDNAGHEAKLLRAM